MERREEKEQDKKNRGGGGQRRRKNLKEGAHVPHEEPKKLSCPSTVWYN